MHGVNAIRVSYGRFSHRLLTLPQKQAVTSGLLHSSCAFHRAEAEHVNIKHYDKLPGPGMFENISWLIRKGGPKNVYEIQCEKFEKFGPIFKEEFFGEKVVHIADADAHKVVAQTEDGFPSRGFDKLVGLVQDIPMYNLIGNDYELWQAARSPIAPFFLRPAEIQKFAPGVITVAKDAVKRFRRELKDGRIVPLKHELDGYATENICFLIFGERMGFYAEHQNPQILEFIKMARDFNEAVQALSVGLRLWRYFPTPAQRKLTNAKKKMFELSNDFGNIRKRKKEKSDDVFLYDKMTDEEGKVDHADVVNGLAIALSQVGVETTSGSLLWCLYYLSRNPEVQEKAYQDIVSAIGTTANDKSLDKPQFYLELAYVKACIKETMRFTQIAAAHSRLLKQETILCGYNIPANTMVLLWPWCLALSAKYFNQPEIFKPERWVRDKQEEKINPFAHIPFGFGVRMCLGRRFAELELAIGLAMILQSFCLEYVGNSLETSNETIKPVLKHGLIVPNQELPIKFHERV